MVRAHPNETRHVHRQEGRRLVARRRHLRAPEGSDGQRHRRVHERLRQSHRHHHQGKPRDRARLRPRHPLEQGGRLLLQDEHGPQLQGRFRFHRHERRGREGGERALHAPARAKRARRPDEKSRILRRSADQRVPHRGDRREERHNGLLPPRQHHLRELRMVHRIHRESALELRLSEPRPNYQLQRQALLLQKRPLGFAQQKSGRQRLV